MARGRTRASRARPRKDSGLLLIVVVLATVGALAAAGSQLDGRGAGAPATVARKPDAPAARGRTLTIAWGARPGSLDPALAADPTATNLIWNLMDPLVKLGDDLEPVPNLAKGWEVSADGTTVTFFLRTDGRWTNGDPVTARDFEYAWKRTLSPDLDSPHASQLLGIKGAAAYNACVGASCAELAASVGVEAVRDDELVVTLASPQPWFVARSAHPAFLPVHEPTVESFGDEWTAARNIVTNGPFSLVGSDDDSVVLAKNPEWRNAEAVALGRVEGRILGSDTARVQAFDAGDVMALDGSGLPAVDIPALEERREYEAYPALGAYFYAFNLASVTDVHQRRAMSLAVDREGLIEHVAESDELPATRYTPAVAPDFGRANPSSPWSPPEGDMTAARAELERAAHVKRRITLLHVDAPGNREIAAALQDAWSELGIETAVKARAADGYLDFRGSLSEESVDLYQVDWRFGFPDALSGLALWTCASGWNKTNFCNPRFDALIERARREPDAPARDALYARAEEVLTGDNGAMPVVPIYWSTYPNLEALTVRDSFAINPLGQIDLSTVEIR